MLEERAGEAAYELKVRFSPSFSVSFNRNLSPPCILIRNEGKTRQAHELSQMRGLHAALLVQRDQASTAVGGQSELVIVLNSVAGAVPAAGPLSEEMAARVEEIVAEYTAVLGEGSDTFDDEGAGYDDEDEDEDDEDDDDDDEEVMAGAASMIQSRVRGNAARKRVDGINKAAAAGFDAPAREKRSSPNKKGLTLDVGAPL